MPFLLPNQQRQSTEGKKNKTNEKEAWHLEIWHDATKMHDVTNHALSWRNATGGNSFAS